MGHVIKIKATTAEEFKEIFKTLNDLPQSVYEQIYIYTDKIIFVIVQSLVNKEIEYVFLKKE